jgi:hypothetical protein
VDIFLSARNVKNKNLRGSSVKFRLALALMALASPAAVLLVSAPVRAQDIAQIATPRAMTCETWNAAKPPPGQPPSAARASQLSRVFDTIIAHDREPERDYYAGQINLTESVDAAEVATWMDNYCAANPRDGFEQAADALVRDLSARWLTPNRNGR